MFTTSFIFDSLTTDQKIAILNSDYDLSDCIVNCSSNGLCKFSSNKTFVCLCLLNYAGRTCSQDTRPCSHSPCLNNGTCLTTLDNSTTSSTNSSSNSTEWGYSCVCGAFYYGTNCQLKKNVCENETCSGNGNCVDTNNTAVCSCYALYEGTTCEIESSTRQTMKTVTSYTTLIAIICIFLIYALILLSDLSNLCCKSQKALHVDARRHMRLRFAKPRYIP